MEKVRSARRTARQAQRSLTEADLFAAILPPNGLAPDKAFRAAVHEVGHAIVALATGTVAVGDIMLSKQGDSHGRTAMAMDPVLPTRAAIEDYVVGALGGRAAELACLGSISAGAGGAIHSDLGIATTMVASLHASYGLGEDLVLRSDAEGVLDVLERDPALRRLVERDLRRLQRRADHLARHHRSAIITLAKTLVLERHICGERVKAIFAQSPLAAAPMGRHRRSTMH